MRIYLDGKIKDMPNKNKAKFDKYEDEFLKLGYQVFNAQRYASSNEHKEYDIVKTEMLLESQKCDTIALIRGWESSDRIRDYIAFWLNNKKKHSIIFADTKLELPKFYRVDHIYKWKDA